MTNERVIIVALVFSLLSLAAIAVAMWALAGES